MRLAMRLELMITQSSLEPYLEIREADDSPGKDRLLLASEGTWVVDSLTSDKMATARIVATTFR